MILLKTLYWKSNASNYSKDASLAMIIAIKESDQSPDEYAPCIPRELIRLKDV